MNKLIIATGTLAVVAVAQIAVAVQTSATSNNNDLDHKVTICHRTGSHTNPYVTIRVAKASILNQGHDTHEGPVFDGTDQDHWGDIIPSFTTNNASYAGKNWDAAGRTIHANDCNVPEDVTTPDEPQTPGQPSTPQTQGTLGTSTTTVTTLPSTGSTGIIATAVASIVAAITAGLGYAIQGVAAKRS